MSEFELIAHLTKDFPSFCKDVVVGVGDDCAVVNWNEQYYLLITTDMLVEGIHFDPIYTPLQHLGWKSVVVNLSDIYAMNGRPLAITVSIAFSNRYNEEMLSLLYRGIRAACKNYRVDLIGGDTTTALKGLSISVTAVGIVEKERLTLRKGAKPNDLICVSGDLGAAYAGLQILEREKAVFLQNPEMQPDLASYEYVVGRQLKPSARRDIMEYFLLNDIVPSAMIDISDGLANEIHHICKQSQCGAVIDLNRLPIDHETILVAERFEVPYTTYALYGGEDYELLFTLHPRYYDIIKTDKDFIHVIGYITDEPQQVYIKDLKGNKVELQPMGWDHLKR